MQVPLPKNVVQLFQVAVVLLIIIGVLVGVYLVQNRQIFQPRAAQSSLCQASDTGGVHQCLNRLNSGEVSSVEIKGQITCSGSNTCNFPEIKNTSPAAIYGTPNQQAGFRRTDNYNYKLFKVRDAANLTIANLTFDDVSPDDCGDSCHNSPITLYGGSNIVLDNNTYKNSKYMGIEVYNTKNLVIKNSHFQNNGWFGLWTDRAESINVENNLFQDNKSNAILGSFTGTSSNQSRIRNNTFTHNHRDVIFFVCGGPEKACPGGQVDITPPTQHLVIERNVIKDGRIDNWDSKGFFAAGLELNADTHDLWVVNNAIYNNTGSGIVVNDANQPSNYNINITNNSVFRNINNSEWNIRFPGANIRDNCTASSGCDIPGDWGYRQVGQSIPSGFGGGNVQEDNASPSVQITHSGYIKVSDNPCIIPAGESLCRPFKLSWSAPSHLVDPIDVRIDKNQPNWRSRSQEVEIPWVGENGMTFYLYSDGHEIESIKIVAQKEPSQQTSSPSVPAQPSSSPSITIPAPSIASEQSQNSNSQTRDRRYDLNKDGNINFTDYRLFIQDFGKHGNNIQSDFNNNSVIDIFDYNLMIGHFLERKPFHGSLQPSTVQRGQVFKFSCDYGVVTNAIFPLPEEELVDTSYESNGCKFDGFNGTAAEFTCKANKSGGVRHPVKCTLNNIEPDYFYYQEDLVGHVTLE